MVFLIEAAIGYTVAVCFLGGVFAEIRQCVKQSKKATKK